MLHIPRLLLQGFADRSEFGFAFFLFDIDFEFENAGLNLAQAFVYFISLSNENVDGWFLFGHM